MGRIRSIKPEFTMDEDLSTLTAETHLMAAGLLCYADDEGYFNANPGLMKAAIFPVRKTSKSILEMLAELKRVGFIRLGMTPDSKHWGHICKFAMHQRVNRPTPSKIMPLSITWELSPNEPSMKTHGGLTEGSPPEGKGREGKGREENGASASAMAMPALPLERFDGAELAWANELFLEFRIPQDFGLTDVTAQALGFECTRLGSPAAAIESMRNAMKTAQDAGETINRFWFSNQRYDPTRQPTNGGKVNGASKSNAATERVINGRKALFTSTLQPGDGDVGAGDRRGHPALPEPGPERVGGRVLEGFRDTSDEALRHERDQGDQGTGD